MSTVEIAGRVQINLLRYERSAATNYYDANWLSCEVKAEIAPFSCQIDATFTTEDFVRLLEGFREATTNSTGVVSLESENTDIKLTMTFDPQGSVSIAGSIQSKDPCRSKLTFDIDNDRWFMAKTIDDLDIAIQVFTVLGTFP